MPNEVDDDAVVVEEGSQEPEGSATTPEAPATQAPDELALARRRQAGADSARKAAETQRDAALAELATLKGASTTTEATDAATLKEQLREANLKIEAAGADKAAAILDIKFPTARAKFPAITDEVQLAELEGFYADAAPEQGSPTPRQHNASKTTGQPVPREKTADDIEAELMAMTVPGWPTT